MAAPDLRVGIDVGGTNTDAVALDRSDALLAKAKVPTSADVTGGITAALAEVMAQLGDQRGRVTNVMLGTTHATNAILERRGLGRVALLRIGGPATYSIRPLFAWPHDLRETVSAGELIVDGGMEFDGREIVPLDLETARRFLESIAGHVDGIAIASVFAPVSAEHELAVGDAARAVLGADVHISLSHEVGTVGLLERENATVLNAALVGVGRTSTDVGVLANGFPRESTTPAEIGGIRTNFRMPDLISVALGGGSIVRRRNGAVDVGPESVGYRLPESALVFGGTTPTLTDAAVAAGRAHLGNAELALARRADLEPALACADAMLAEAIDRVKLARGAQPLIVVGGGSVLVPDELPGVSAVQRPEHFDVANAIGAALASVSGQVDRIFHAGPGGRRAAVEEACDEARIQAVRAGADPDSIEIVEVE